MKITDIRITGSSHLHVTCEGEHIVLPGRAATAMDDFDFRVNEQAAREARPDAFEDHAYRRWLNMLPEVAQKYGLRVELQ